MTNGMGFIAVALVYFGGWRPLGVMGGALLFSLVNAFQFTVQLNKDIAIPYDVLIMLPYILTILALAFARHTQTTAALSKPFERGEN
jgi:simple sugar transport system permease protein